jgi:hypothetical protein
MTQVFSRLNFGAAQPVSLTEPHVQFARDASAERLRVPASRAIYLY